MTAKRLKRPPDPVQLGKLVGDILTGQVEDRSAEKPRPAKDASHRQPTKKRHRGAARKG
jgi:hypothetical protein